MKSLLKRSLLMAMALTTLAAAPANEVELTPDRRIPATDQKVLERELTAALGEHGLRGTVTISLRVIEPERPREVLVAP